MHRLYDWRPIRTRAACISMASCTLIQALTSSSKSQWRIPPLLHLPSPVSFTTKGMCEPPLPINVPYLVSRLILIWPILFCGTEEVCVYGRSGYNNDRVYCIALTQPFCSTAYAALHYECSISCAMWALDLHPILCYFLSRLLRSPSWL